MAQKKESRCWPGYEPVPGKPEHSEGSCRKKADSKLTPSEKTFRAKREKQLDEWKKEHPQSPRKAAQHLHAPGTTTKTKRNTKRKSAPSGAARKKTSKKAA